MKHIRKLSLYVIWLLAAMMFGGAASATAADRSVTVGSASGVVDAIVSIPITLAGPTPTDVGGIAFTLAYDPAFFEYQSIEAITPQVMSKDPAYTGPVQSTIFYMDNDEKAGTPATSIGRLKIAAASAMPITQATPFNVKFRIKGGNGPYPINITQTIIGPDPIKYTPGNDPAIQAGYSTAMALPVLVGTSTFNADPLVNKYDTTIFPTYAANLFAGRITVGTTYGIGGKVTLGTTGSAAIGATVVLKRSPQADGDFVYDSQTTSNGTGNYTFTSKTAGIYYKVFVTSNYPNYTNFETAAFQLSTAVSDKNIQLPAQPLVSLTGSVTINNLNVPGVQVQVWNGSTLLGTYPVDANGNFTTAPFPQGGNYTLKAIYGSLLPHDITTGANNWTATLRTISGTIGNRPASTTTSVTASSVVGKLLKTVTANAGTGAYIIENLVPADDYVVSATAAGAPVTYYNGVTDISTATPVHATADVTADFSFPTTSGTVSGTVVEGVGEAAVANMVVYASDISNGNLTFALTDGQGVYTLTLPLGTYEIFVIKNNGKIFYYNDVKTTQNQADATLQTIIVSQLTHTGKKINLTECTNVLSGTVTFRLSGGDPAPNVLITATSPLGGGMALTGPGGAYSIGGLCSAAVGAADNQYHVEMNPLSSLYAVQSAPVSFTAATATQNFIIGKGNTLLGAVKDGNGTGIVGATIYLTNQLTGLMVNGRMYTSGGGGEFTIADIDTGVYALNVTHPQYQPNVEQNLQIDRDIGTTDARKLVTLTKGRSFNGTVRDSVSTATLSGVLVIFINTTTAGVAPVYAVTNASGYYEVFGLANANYTILAQKTGYNRNSASGVPVEGGTTKDIALTKPATTYNWSGTVSAGGSPVANAYILISSASNSFFASTSTDNTGAYSFANLPMKGAPGDYTLVVVPGGALKTYVAANLTLTENRTGVNAYNVTIPTGHAISGQVTVTGASGTISVYLFTAAKAFVDITTAIADPTTNGNYNYSFPGLEDGAYLVLVIAPAKAPKWYDNQASIDAANPINVSGANVSANISFQ